ncbi:tRNA (guanine-N(1)-)-methyltransferase [Dictyocaulus viviparus]|uniref:RNA (guanine-9-)-methyltransferase domain-containing protein 1 n=1 Tax=Dictyocaulus viviparus TaxID=29172 RepID=A0A0D8YCC1_DICVI|nr:tRNA (guanine-N(1)-)-methyltransferase [Dictyocaulus viviparus]
MKWLINLWLLSQWKFRRCFRLHGQSIAPIQWRNPLLTSYPSQELVNTLNNVQRKRLHTIVEETRTISMLTKHFPSEISAQNWIILLECHTRKQRLDYLKFLRSKELKRSKEKSKKLEKCVFQPEKRKERSEYPFYIPIRKMEKQERRIAWERVARAFRLGSPILVVDCRFLPLLSPRGAELTAIQLKYLISENRDDRTPWPLYFTNFDQTSERIRRLKERHLSGIESPTTCCPIVSPLSFSCLFPQEKIVYLSPDAQENLTSINEDYVYVLGGIVDRVTERNIPRQASLQTALYEQVRCKRLPLDEYIEWKSGSKFLTLTAVFSILRSVYSSGGDWKTALVRHIPVRNTRSSDEKSIAGRQFHDKIRRFDHQLLRILDDEIGKDSIECAVHISKHTS